MKGLSLSFLTVWSFCACQTGGAYAQGAPDLKATWRPVGSQARNFPKEHHVLGSSTLVFTSDEWVSIPLEPSRSDVRGKYADGTKAGVTLLGI